MSKFRNKTKSDKTPNPASKSSLYIYKENVIVHVLVLTQ